MQRAGLICIKARCRQIGKTGPIEIRTTAPAAFRRRVTRDAYAGYFETDGLGPVIRDGRDRQQLRAGPGLSTPCPADHVPDGRPVHLAIAQGRRAEARHADRLHGRRDPRRRDRHRLLGRGGLPGRHLHRLPARLPGAEPGPALDHLRPAAAAAHLGGDLRLRRQRADLHLVLRRAAHLRGAALGRQPGLVRVLGLPAVHRAGRDRLSAGRHPVQGIRRARVVRRPLADHRLGRLPGGLPGHHDQAQRAAHLRRQLVPAELHRHRGDAARGQQPQPAGQRLRLEIGAGLLGRAGRADAVVVRP